MTARGKSPRCLRAGLLAGALALAPAAGGMAAGDVGLARETFVDSSRPTRASPPFAGAPDRRLDTWIWYPAAGGGGAPMADAPPRADGPWPLVVYSHGTGGRPDDATHLCEHLARNGYVVAAPAFPLEGVAPAPLGTPALLLVGDADVFEAQTGGPAAAYARLPPPKRQVMIRGAPHVWFGDRDHVPPGGVNPDCIWFEKNTGARPPQCAGRRALIVPARQKEITRYALLAFFDAYLKDDAAGLERLDAVGRTFGEVTLRRELAGP